MTGIQHAHAAAYWTSGSSSSSSSSLTLWGGWIGPITDIAGSGPTTPAAASTYWASSWLLETWPTPATTNSTIVAPVSSLSVAIQAEAPSAISIGANAGEFFIMDSEGMMHAVPAQKPDRWLGLGALPARPGQAEFSFYTGVQLLTQDGFATYDPERGIIGSLSDAPLLTEHHPVRFVQYSRVFVLPGVTYHDGSSWPYAFGAHSNFGLTLPRPVGAPADAALRPHQLSEIVYSEGIYYALGTLHPETPGFTPGTQAVFKCSDRGITWSFQPLPKLIGRWRALAISHGSTVVGKQFVVVGDDGIYTSRDAGATWLHIASNLTTATATNFTLTLPEGTDAPINEPLALRLNSVAWAGDRFIAAGSTQTSDGQAVYIEGLSKHWFAYPLRGWPANRAVDQIEHHYNRCLLLGKAVGPDSTALLAADVPPQGSAPEGAPSVLSIAPTFAPILGTYTSLPFTVSSSPARRFIIEGDNTEGWQALINANVLIPPYEPKLNYSYHLQDEPLRLTITAVNEFGRSDPVTVTVDSVLPGPYASYKSPELILPQTVRAVFGAAVHIPVKARKDQNWSPGLIWAYGLPDGLFYDPRKQAIVGHALVSGAHQIHLLAFNRYAQSYSSSSYFTSSSLAAPITLAVSEPKPAPADAGLFAGLLEGANSLMGSWTLTIRPDRTFTGTVTLASGTHPLRGSLVAEAGLPGTYSTSLIISRKNLPPLEIAAVLHTAEGRVALLAASGSDEASTSGGTVANIPWSKNRYAPRAGDYSAAIRFTPPTGASPGGQGFLRMQVSTLGKARMLGELANGLKWTAAASLAVDGRLPFSAKIAGTRSLRGTLAFPADSVTSTALRGELAWRSASSEKCPVYGTSTTLSVVGGLVPEANAYGTNLYSGKHELTLSQPDLVRFGIENGEARVVFDTHEAKKLVVARGSPQTNPLRVALRFDRDTKLASGSFILTSVTGRKSSISLRAAPVSDPDSGETLLIGYFLIPSAEGNTHFSGEVRSKLLP